FVDKEGPAIRFLKDEEATVKYDALIARNRGQVRETILSDTHGNLVFAPNDSATASVTLVDGESFDVPKAEAFASLHVKPQLTHDRPIQWDWMKDVEPPTVTPTQQDVFIPAGGIARLKAIASR